MFVKFKIGAKLNFPRSKEARRIYSFGSYQREGQIIMAILRGRLFTNERGHVLIRPEGGEGRERGHKWSLVLIRNRKIASKRFISKRTQFFEMVLIRKEEGEGEGGVPLKKLQRGHVLIHS